MIIIYRIYDWEKIFPKFIFQLFNLKNVVLYLYSAVMANCSCTVKVCADRSRNWLVAV